MAEQSRAIFERLYGKATTPEQLPWYRPDPPALLVEALARREHPGTALDVGCGAGAYSLYLAKRGYSVTGVDFMPGAISMLQTQVTETDLDITAVQADILTWETCRPFDVVLDVGCLHSLGKERQASYKARLLRWLAPGGDFILTHCGKRAWWDWWPIGPHRESAYALASLLAPELVVHKYEPEMLTGMPLFMGRTALVNRFWFRRVAQGPSAG
jgi:SAM-dependent methyltransferase